MFKDRVFNISFLISFLWHIFCIFAVVLVISPKGFVFNNFPAIAFLGPILEKDAFRSSYNLNPVFMPTPYKEDFALDERVFDEDYRNLNAVSLPDKTLDRIEFGERRIEKEVPDFAEGITPPTSSGLAATSLRKDAKFLAGLVIEGPLAERPVIYRPRLPRLPSWALEKGENFSIDLKILVSANGTVYSVNRLTTTGYPEIDLLAIKNALGLIFQPADFNIKQEGRLRMALDAK